MSVEEREASPSGESSSLSSEEELCESAGLGVAATEAPPGFRLNTTERQP